ncbi:hypothetical protein JCM13664_13140 [Methylothermus subterraneus]|nr:hypothetical conserved protein [uncultured Gammaproteobacteria bacterium]
MVRISDIHIQYISDEKGEKKAVILPLSEFEELLEDLEDLAALAERRDEQTVPHEELMHKLERDGLLPD